MQTLTHHDGRLPDMRTTVTLDDDVAAAVARLRAERQIGLSVALNELARAGMVPAAAAGQGSPRFVQQTWSMGPSMDLRDVAEVLELAEGPEHR